MMADGMWLARKQRKTFHQPRLRRESNGELIQIDGSEHRWFEDRADPCTLLVFVDDATSPAVFELRVQLNTGLEDMPIEDASAEWSEDDSQYQGVARLELPVQTAWDREKDDYFEELSFSPGHALEAHRPLGSINRARLVVYRALAARRLSENHKTEEKPTELAAVPDC